MTAAPGNVLTVIPLRLSVEIGVQNGPGAAPKLDPPSRQ